MFALRQATRTIVQTTTRRSFASAAPVAVPSLRKSRLPRARGINSTPIVEGPNEEGIVPSAAAIDETIVHEYPQEHEFEQNDLVSSGQRSQCYTLNRYTSCRDTPRGCCSNRATDSPEQEMS